MLLRPLAIRRHHSDFELKLQGVFEVNPELVRIAREHFGITIDAAALASLAYDGGIFKPQPVIDSLRATTRSIDTFTVEPRLVVSTFADVGGAMARDGRSLDHSRAQRARRPRRRPRAGLSARARLRTTPARTTARRHPTTCCSMRMPSRRPCSRGSPRAIPSRSPRFPGTGGTQTVINAVGELVRGGKRVLVVSARRSTLDGVRHRLAGIGLDSLAVSPASVRRDLVRAIGRNEKATAPKVSDVDDALVRLRTVLRDYRQALTAPVAGTDASVLDATRHLTRLASLPGSAVDHRTPRAPRRCAASPTTARRRRPSLAHAARLGEFRFGPDDSPWYGVTFSSTEAARAAHELAGRLHSDSVPALLERGYALIAQTHMRPFSTIDELGEYLRLLQGIRDSLDRFSPTVFERPLGELIQAHGSRRDAPGLSGANRRRLRRLAKEYVRPGVHVTEMHEALLRIQAQRTQWQRCVEAGVAPEVPLGLADVAVAWQRAEAELAELDAALGRREPLASLPVARLVRTLAGSRCEVGCLREPGRARAAARPAGAARARAAARRALGPPCLRESSRRGARVRVVAVPARTRTAGQSGAARCEHRSGRSTRARFPTGRRGARRDGRSAARLAAGESVEDRDRRRAAAVAASASSADAADLRRPLRSSALRRLSSSVLAPVWISSPYLVPEIPESVEFDTVILVDAAAVNLAETAPAIRRARQVVAFGDPVTQRPTPFHIAVDPSDQWEAEVPFDDTSVFERLSELLPVMTLTRSYRAGGEDLAELINDAFYGGEIVSLPWAGSYLGRGSLTVDYVEGGTGAPDPISGAVESPDAEVARVVTLVVEHAVHRPSESLMVVTASTRHAERVRAAVTTAFAGRSDVADFVGRDTAEPFAVLTLEESVAESRDRVIFSLGFGLTKHGRVLSDFGDLSTPDGERLLTVGMTRARRSMVIVSSIRPSSFDDGRLEHGAATLMSILGGLATRSRDARLEDLADPLTLALARELRRLGASVDVDYRGRLPLVAQHKGKAVVIESDPESRGESLRETLRLRPHVLRRLGWHYVRVHAFDLYSDPVTVATRIASVLGIAESAPRADNDTQPIDIVDNGDV